MKVAVQHAVTSLHSAWRLSLQHLKNKFYAGVLEQLLSNLALGKQDWKLSLQFYGKVKWLTALAYREGPSCVWHIECSEKLGMLILPRSPWATDIQPRGEWWSLCALKVDRDTVYQFSTGCTTLSAFLLELRWQPRHHLGSKTRGKMRHN